MYRSTPGNIDTPHLKEEALVGPHPVCWEDVRDEVKEGVHHVRLQIRPLRHHTTHDGGRSRGKRKLEPVFRGML